MNEVPVIYCINLERKKEYLEKYLEKNKEFGDKIVIFKAVDGQKPGEIPQHLQRTNGRAGCYLSHQGVWKDILKRGHEFAIITEDDADIQKHLVEDIGKFKNKMIEMDLDVLLLHWTPKNCTKPGTSADPIVQELKGRFNGTHFLMVSKKGVKNLLKKTNPLGDRPIDVDLYEQNDTGSLKVGLANSRVPYGKIIPHQSETEKMEGVGSNNGFFILAVVLGLGFFALVIAASVLYMEKEKMSKEERAWYVARILP